MFGSGFKITEFESRCANTEAEPIKPRTASEVKKNKPRFCAKTISNYVQVVKMVVASVVNDKGEEIYPVKWNHDFMDLPEVKDQRTPTFTADEISAIISKAEGEYQVLCEEILCMVLLVARQPGSCFRSSDHFDGPGPR